MTPDPTTLGAAFIAGIAGSAHCMGMCGGIVASLGLGTAGERSGPWRSLGYALLYNGGRIASYTVAGVIVGSVGLLAGGSLQAPGTGVVLRAITGLVLIAIGLQVAFGLRLLQPIERVGLRLWGRIAPLARGLMARRGAWAAVGLGALWGWLPCGLVYGMLFAALAAANPVESGGLMAAFGLGTAPAMIATGAFASRFRRYTHHPRFRRIAGLVVIGLGLWTALAPIVMLMGGGHVMP
ncbi:sulfite exporter TauE/SafE family protein [Halofilum ochraceum]|uniref:sulfite exporter TauE/SafE family protein n=1 Tax=Halofilum ochraceum TaxID=1611323 RepID=UPI000830CA85|nr:sulfite exporter TauE/SafE family protein [Halofilum ochraceum]